MLGIIRIKASNFIELFRSEINAYLNSTVQQTIVEYISQLDDDSNPNIDDEHNVRLNDQVRLLKMQEFLAFIYELISY